MTKFQRTMCWLMLLLSIYFTFLVLWQYNAQCEYQGVSSQLGQENVTVSHFKPYSVYVVANKTTFTAYTLSVDETDGTPCIGAGNNNLCELRKEMRICASRDLPLDTLIYIQGVGECVIKDRMNIRYKGTNTIDILMETRQEALKFGKRELNYVIVK